MSQHMREGKKRNQTQDRYSVYIIPGSRKAAQRGGRQRLRARTQYYQSRQHTRQRIAQVAGHVTYATDAQGKTLAALVAAQQRNKASTKRRSKGQREKNGAGALN